MPPRKQSASERAADLEDQLGLRAAHVELGALHERRADAEGVAQQLEHRVVEVDQALPARLEDLLQRGQVEVRVGRGAVRVAQRRGLDARPVAL